MSYMLYGTAQWFIKAHVSHINSGTDSDSNFSGGISSTDTGRSNKSSSGTEIQSTKEKQ